MAVYTIRNITQLLSNRTNLLYNMLIQRTLFGKSFTLTVRPFDDYANYENVYNHTVILTFAIFRNSHCIAEWIKLLKLNILFTIRMKHATARILMYYYDILR